MVDSEVVTDAVNALPDAFGICGETPSSSESVEINNVYADPGAGVKIRITD